jgi:hypothetical protein
MPYKHKKNCAIEKKALKAAKKLERIPEPTDKDIEKILRESMAEAQRLQKLLKPEWFVKDTDKPSKKKKKK